MKYKDQNILFTFTGMEM